MNAGTKYDQIGCGYNRFRKAEPRLVQRLIELLAVEPNDRVMDVGAGSGNYSNAIASQGFWVTAIEPSRVMREQAKPHPHVEWVNAVAEQIPCANDSVDGVVAILSSHHFSSLDRAVSEMVRVARESIVVLSYDPRVAQPFWLSDYFPEVFEKDRAQFPPIDHVSEKFEACHCETRIERFPIPSDIVDQFLAGPWQRPHMYLDSTVRSGMSVFALADPEEVAQNVARLAEDLETGAWQQKYGAVLLQSEFDAGYRFVVAHPQ